MRYRVPHDWHVIAWRKWKWEQKRRVPIQLLGSGGIMKVLSAEQMKGSKYGPKTRRAHPKEGSKLRQLYDYFLMNRGLVIQISFNRKDCSNVEVLRDFYGLDIRNIRRGAWVLAGEWINGKYKDYIAEQLKVRG